MINKVDQKGPWSHYFEWGQFILDCMLKHFLKSSWFFKISKSLFEALGKQEQTNRKMENSCEEENIKGNNPIYEFNLNTFWWDKMLIKNTVFD